MRHFPQQVKEISRANSPNGESPNRDFAQIVINHYSRGNIKSPSQTQGRPKVPQRAAALIDPWPSPVVHAARAANVARPRRCSSPPGGNLGTASPGAASFHWQKIVK